jgi:hypothetical protein
VVGASLGADAGSDCSVKTIGKAALLAPNCATFGGRARHNDVTLGGVAVEMPSERFLLGARTSMNGRGTSAVLEPMMDEAMTETTVFAKIRGWLK